MSELDILRYIPHRKKMVLIDKIVNPAVEKFCVEVSITKTSLLVEKEGVPSYVAIEYMAQSIAAYNTYHYSEEKKGERAPIGFIVSVRNFKSTKEYFVEGSLLKIFIEPVLIVKNSGSFQCQVKCNNEVICSARITAYVPTKEELQELKSEALNG